MLLDPYIWPTHERLQQFPEAANGNGYKSRWSLPAKEPSVMAMFFYAEDKLPDGALPISATSASASEARQPPRKKVKHPIYKRDKLPSEIDAIVIGR